jgi:CheY-like chemotaxis protein
MDFRVSRPGRLFVVDDDAHVLASLKFTFEADGCEVVACTSGEALVNLQLEPSDCIIIDEKLPGRTGLETLTMLRAAGVVTPAVLITTHPSHAVRRRAAELGVGIVEKPLIGNALSQSVAALMAR